MNVFVSRENSADVDHRCDPVNGFRELPLLNGDDGLEGRNSGADQAAVLRKLNANFNDTLASGTGLPLAGRLAGKAGEEE